MDRLHCEALPHLIFLVPDQARDQEDIDKVPDARGNEQDGPNDQDSCHDPKESYLFYMTKCIPCRKKSVLVNAGKVRWRAGLCR